MIRLELISFTFLEFRQLLIALVIVLQRVYTLAEQCDCGYGKTRPVAPLLTNWLGAGQLEAVAKALGTVQGMLHRY